MKAVTIRRLLCAAAVLAGAILIGYRGGAAAYLLFWTALLVPLLALLCRVIFRRSLLVTLKTETDEVLRGERVPCRLELLNRGFLPMESTKDAVNIGMALRRVPLTRRGERISRNYCAFWKKNHAGSYTEAFVDMLKENFLKKDKHY